MKSKQELIKNIKSLAREGSQQWPHEEMVELPDVLREINQLDEPEVNSQIDKLANFIMSEVEGEPSQNQGAADTAIRIIKSYQNQDALSQEWIDEHAFGDWNEYVYADDLQEVIVPKQDEVEVPQFVADCIESAGSNRESNKEYVIRSIIDQYYERDFEPIVYDWFGEKGNLLKFYRAVDNGHTVEEEQKYYVINNDQRMMLVRMMDGNTITESDQYHYGELYDDEKKSHRLTEQEIKDYDERYFAFAVKVEELEE